MRACFAFDPPAWEQPEARFAVATLASLLEMPWREAPAGAGAGDDEALVFVGAPASAPAGAAAIIAVEGWPRWDAASLDAAEFDGERIPCPRGMIETPTDPRVLPAAWLRAAGFLLAREEETQDLRRDPWDCYSGLFSRQHALGMLDRAVVNRLARQLERRIEEHAGRRQAVIERVTRWKDGARFAAALTHDVDDVTLHSMAAAWRLLRQARGPSSYAFRAGLAGLLRALRHASEPADPYWNLGQWLAEEERRGFRSTFFFCPTDPARRHEYDALYRMSDIVGFEGRRVPLVSVLRAMAARGHEIGLHGSYLSHLDAGELARQKRQIEDAAGHEVVGLRQHFLRFAVRGTWSAQEAAGFRYDCTLGYNEALGFRAGIAAPFRPWDPDRRRRHSLLELPLTAMDGVLFRTLGLGPAAAARRIRAHLDVVEEAGGLAVLLWHPNAAAAGHFPGWWDGYVTALDHLQSRGAWVATAAEIGAWWTGRSSRQNPAGAGS